MPGIATPELVAAVAEAGGLGMVPTPLLDPTTLGETLDEVARRTGGAVGTGFLVPFLDRDCLALAAQRVRVVEFFYGEPDPGLVELAHRGGALAAWQVGSRDEALAAVAADCDFLSVQGTEAGGHVRGRLGLLPLLAQVLDAVEVPVLAAGGIATPRDLAGVLATGAAGARLGTRFVASRESGAHPRYVEALLAAEAEDTVLTEAFSHMWPDAPHRVLRSCVEAAQGLGDEVVGEAVFGGRPVPVGRLSVICPGRDTTGAIEAMALYAGQSVGSIRRVEPVVGIVRELVEGAEALLRGGA
jgi:nitronate monooxygenase